METYNLAYLTKKLYDTKLPVFSTKSLKDILEVKKESTYFSVVERLTKAEVIKKIEKNKYILSSPSANDFLIANFLYQPSYISLETALNLHGILSQFPYEITSITTRKTNRKKFEGKTFSYLQIKRNLFWGYVKMNDSLIATPEKSLLDQIYFASKGLRSISIDEYDTKTINRRKLQNFATRFPKTREFMRLLKSILL